MNPALEPGGQPAPESAFPSREERRPTALTGWLVRPNSVEAHDFVLVNLSYGGCRIRTDAALARGDQVQLTVHSRGTIPAVVRWRNGQGVGLSFVVEEPARPEIPRGDERRPIGMEVVVRRAGRRAQPLDAIDISRHGCCLTFVDPPRTGDWIWITLPGLEPVEGRIRWVDGHRAGVGFVRPIHDAVFDLLLLRWEHRRG